MVEVDECILLSGAYQQNDTSKKNRIAEGCFKETCEAASYFAD
jgi:hypothetical protein